MLDKLINKKTLTVLGLNSGTSADGLDLAAVRISRRNGRVQVKFLAGASRAYPVAVRRKVLGCADGTDTSVNDVIYLDNLLGGFYGKQAAAFIRKLAKQGIKVDAVASHGQTVRHLPAKADYGGRKVRGTLQLGSLEQIATATGVAVVGDFRQGDVAVGGEGAPITIAASGRLFRSGQAPRLIVNIGGMSNFFYFPQTGDNRAVAAADCGPGNSLSDLLTDRLFGQKYDRGGRRARAGRVSQRLLTLLLAEPFYTGRNISTGRETFGRKLADRMISFGDEFDLASEDLVATAVELTAESIKRAVAPILKQDPGVTKLYLTGGGARNTFLRCRLSDVCGRTAGTVTELGFDPDLVEALAFAVMGEACLRSEALPTRFGRTGRQTRNNRMLPVLGKIAQPPQKA